MEARKVTLNENQKYAIKWYGIPQSEIEACDWFNKFSHVKALGYLLKTTTHLTYRKALAVLEHLNGEQAEGIFNGLTREEVMGLNKTQIESILKYNLSRNEVEHLNAFQISAYIFLSHKGLELETLRKTDCLTSDEYVMALGYLVTRKSFSFQEAFDLLAQLTWLQANLVCCGLSLEDFSELEDESLWAFLDAKKFQGLQTQSDFYQLTRSQIEIVKELYHWGMTSDLIRQHSWLRAEHQPALFYLLTTCFMGAADAILKIQDLNKDELKGICLGLSVEEIKKLENSYQMFALAKNKTIKNKLSAEDFQNKSWFNSEAHVSTFNYLLTCKFFTVKQAFEELEGLSSDQAKLIHNGEARDNIIGLNQWMLSAIKLNQYSGLKGKHLRDKFWFDGCEYVNGLSHLISNNLGNFSEDMLVTLEKAGKSRLKLFAETSYTFKKLQSLTDIQVKILTEKLNYPSVPHYEIAKATWLTTDEHYEAFVLLYKKMKLYAYDVMNVLKLASEQNRISELVDTLKNDPGMGAWEKPVQGLDFFKIQENTKQAESGYSLYNLFSYFVPQDNSVPQTKPKKTM